MITLTSMVETSLNSTVIQIYKVFAGFHIDLFVNASSSIYPFGIGTTSNFLPRRQCYNAKSRKQAEQRVIDCVAEF